MADVDEPVRLIEREGAGDRFLLYTDSKGVRVELRHVGDALWMTQAQMAELFGIDVRTVNEHLQNIYREGELEEEATIRNFRIVRSEGSREVSRDILHYGLDAVISVGYRVSSTQGTLFRKWATGVLVRFATSGFVVDVERLKAPEQRDRIAELREIIRDIRASEANLYAELRQVCALCQDYDPKSAAARTFYQHTQAKLFHAVTNHTPAEIINARADAAQDNMGLHTWPRTEITKADALVAKNYLAESEIRELNRLTTIMLDIFEDQLDVGRLTTMAQAQMLLEQHLAGLGRRVLGDGGSVSSEQAKAHAADEYRAFDAQRKAQRVVETARELAALKAADKALPKARASRPGKVGKPS